MIKMYCTVEYINPVVREAQKYNPKILLSKMLYLSWVCYCLWPRVQVPSSHHRPAHTVQPQHICTQIKYYFAQIPRYADSCATIRKVTLVGIPSGQLEGILIESIKIRRIYEQKTNFVLENLFLRRLQLMSHLKYIICLISYFINHNHFLLWKVYLISYISSQSNIIIVLLGSTSSLARSLLSARHWPEALVPPSTITTLVSQFLSPQLCTW